jgi:hypothetical protein
LIKRAADTIGLAITLDVASGGYLVELITPELWPQGDQAQLSQVYSETLVPFDELESGASDERLKAFLAMHLKFLGFR